MSDIFTLDENNNAAVRTVGVKAGTVESNQPDIFTTDENGNAAVRVVGSGGSVDEDRVIIKSADIPEASADVLGQMYCYDGATNATYTHGYVYECVEGQPTYTDSVEFEPATISGTVVTATNNSLAGLCEEYITGDITSIVSGTMTYDESGDIWAFVGKDAEDNTVGSFQLYTQDFIDAGFTFTGTLADGDVVAFTCTITESSTYVWERIDLQPAAKLGRYLAGWNCATGLAMTNPPESPYEYTTGDYFIVGVVATGGASNYKPNGSSYITGVASTTVESESVSVNDMYLYDGTNWTLLKTGSTVTSVNGQTGDVTVQETLVSGTNIKTINGNSILGAGNLQVSGFLPFPAGWTTNSTTKALCDDIAADTTTVKGSAFLGEVTCSDLPASIVNSEINVYINDGTTAADKVIILELTSGNVAPYRWIYVYWNGGTDVSGWKTWQETLVSGTNIKTINGSSVLGSGDLTISGLPSQTGNAGKFLQTDGTDASWGALSSKTTATLLANGWTYDSVNSRYEQTVNVTGVTASNDVEVSPYAVNYNEWGNCGVFGAAQAVGTITFWADSEPTNDLQFTAIIRA